MTYQYINFKIRKRQKNENGYTDELTIDRIDNNKNYKPTNCRWATQKEQNRNYSKNHTIIFDGKKYCAIELSEKFGVPYRRLLWRIRQNWATDKIIEKGDFRYGKQRKRTELL